MTRCHEPALLLSFEINSIEIFIKKRGTNNETVYQCGY